MFGGGVEPGVNDPVTLIRVPTIRGHLRFWWRATRGTAFADPAVLRKHESEVFGSTEHESSLVVSVRNVKPGKMEACAAFPPGRRFPEFAAGHPGYALFPFQGKADEADPAEGHRDASFDLVLDYPKDFETDILAAVWAWTNFGGIGARTRRGCGSLYCKEFAPVSEKNLGLWWTEMTGRFVKDAGSPREWPTLGRKPRALLNLQPPMSAWEVAVNMMKDFRQGPGLGRNPDRIPKCPDARAGRKRIRCDG